MLKISCAVVTCGDATSRVLSEDVGGDATNRVLTEDDQLLQYRYTSPSVLQQDAAEVVQVMDDDNTPMQQPQGLVQSDNSDVVDFSAGKPCTWTPIVRYNHRGWVPSTGAHGNLETNSDWAKLSDKDINALSHGETWHYYKFTTTTSWSTQKSLYIRTKKEYVDTSMGMGAFSLGFEFCEGQEAFDRCTWTASHSEHTHLDTNAKGTTNDCTRWWSNNAGIYGCASGRQCFNTGQCPGHHHSILTNVVISACTPTTTPPTTPPTTPIPSSSSDLYQWNGETPSWLHVEGKGDKFYIILPEGENYFNMDCGRHSPSTRKWQRVAFDPHTMKYDFGDTTYSKCQIGSCDWGCTGSFGLVSNGWTGYSASSSGKMDFTGTPVATSGYKSPQSCAENTQSCPLKSAGRRRSTNVIVDAVVHVVDETQWAEAFSPPRVACENPGHRTFPSCTMERTGVCHGHVRLGYKERQSDWKEVDGTFECSNKFFGGDPWRGQAKECVCRNL